MNPFFDKKFKKNTENPMKMWNRIRPSSNEKQSLETDLLESSFGYKMKENF